VGIFLALPDLSAERAQVVLRLNRAGIPVIAWLSLPPAQGYYLNANNAREAFTRFSDFETWSTAYRLRWAGVGLDIEPKIWKTRTDPDNGHLEAVQEFVESNNLYLLSQQTSYVDDTALGLRSRPACRNSRTG
jgi:hypothetical protein